LEKGKSVIIKQSNAKIRAIINKALAKEGDIILSRSAANIERKVKDLVKTAISSSPEISSLSSGSLKFDFGLTEDPSSQIVNAVVNSVFVDVKKVRATKGKFSGGITINIQPSSFSNLLSLSVATQDIESGGSIPWLNWLLTQGDAIIIADFGVEYGTGTGRSGGATMDEKFAPFRVDPSYSGTVDNNFITRAIQPYLRKISQIVKSELQ
jgi:hypothetical protein